MERARIVSLLDSILPDIVKSGNPEEELLKCAKDNNLEPAQLESLGQCFNTAKHLYGLEKSANRGETFSIVNVPEMMTSYTTYDPDKELSRANKSVHKKVDNLSKVAYGTVVDDRVPGEGVLKLTSCDSYGSGAGLPSLNASLAYTVFDEASAYEEMPVKSAASTGPTAKDIIEAEELQKRADALIEQVLYEAQEDRKEAYTEIMKRASYDLQSWSEVVEDISKTFGRPGEEIVVDVEHSMRGRGLKFPVYNVKTASANPFVYDRHGFFPAVEKILMCNDVIKQASTTVDKITPPDKGGKKDGGSKKKDKKDSSGVNPVQFLSDTANVATDAINRQPMAEVIGSLLDSKKKTMQDLDEARTDAESSIALQSIKLEDPIIAAADPDMVDSLYNTIAALSPTFAKDRNLMGPALKEAIQYGALPPQTAKQIVDIEKAVTDSKKNTTFVESDLYGS